MVKEGVCYSLIRASRPLMNGLVTRPIAGVDWTIDTAFVTKAEYENPALSWFVEELAKYFRTTPEIPARKPVASVRGQGTGQKPADRMHDNQLALFAADDESGEDRHRRKL
jgi:hypothetical protein